MKKVCCIFLAFSLFVLLCACGVDNKYTATSANGNKYTVTSADGTVGQYSVKELKELQNDAIAFGKVVSGAVITGQGKITKIASSFTFAGQWADKTYYTVYINDDISVRIRSEFASDFSVGDEVWFEGRYYSLLTVLELLPVNDNFNTPSPSIFK